MISAVVLAAGRAERMGEQKLLLPLNDKPVLQWVLESALASSVHEVTCVVRDLKAVRQRIALAHHRLHWLINYAADRGQSTSVIAGLWAIEPRSDGALFLVGDQPLVRKDLLDALIRTIRTELGFDRCSLVQGTSAQSGSVPARTLPGDSPLDRRPRRPVLD